MKLNKFFFALMAVALPLGFTACSSDDDEKGSEQPTYVNQEHAARYTFSQSSGVQSVTFGESNSVIIAATNENGETEYVVGTYQASVDKQTGVTTYTVSSGKGTYSFKVGADNSTTITYPSGRVETTASQKTTSADHSQKTTSILGDWKPNCTVLKLKKKTAAGWIAPDPLPGIDFQKVKNRAEQEGCKIEEDFKDDYIVKTVSFLGTKEFNVSFTSGEGYVAEWQWYQWPNMEESLKDGGIKFVWKDEKANDNQFLREGKAACVLKTDGPYKGELHLTLVSVVESGDEEWDVQILFRLVR